MMYKSETLYKSSSKGKELQWNIFTHANVMDDSYSVVTRHGQVNGKLQETSFNITSGKNICKANETSIEEQADSEAKSKFAKQIDKGYSLERGGEPKTNQPMLAHKYNDHRNKVTFPCYVQPKLDGMRCVAIRNGDKITLMSRGNKVIEGLNHIRTDLLQFMNDEEAFDGELYNHKVKFQDGMSLVKRDQDNSKYVEYHVYDRVSTKSFCDRFASIFYPYHGKGSIKFVQTGLCKSHDEVQSFHDNFVRLGYEGVMIRNGDCKYKEGGRSNQLLKLKAFDDDEFEIVDVIPSDRAPTHGVFVCRMTGTNETFRATPEGKFELKEQYLRDRANYIGKQLTVRYFGLTTSEVPVPRFPIAVGIRED